MNQLYNITSAVIFSNGCCCVYYQYFNIKLELQYLLKLKYLLFSIVILNRTVQLIIQAEINSNTLVMHAKICMNHYFNI